MVWNCFPDIFVHGNSTADQPTLDVHISNNETPDAMNQCNLMLTAMTAQTDVIATHNRVLFAPRLVNKAPGIVATDNGPAEPGATVRGPGCSLPVCDVGGAPPPFPAAAAVRPPQCNKPPPGHEPGRFVRTLLENQGL